MDMVSIQVHCTALNSSCYYTNPNPNPVRRTTQLLGPSF